MSTIPGFYTVHEAAVVLQRDHSTICRYVRDGKIPAKRIGREMLLDQKIVKQFVLPEPGNPALKKQKS